MAALPQWAEASEPELNEPLAPRPVTVFRVRRDAMPPHWYRNRPLIRLRCPSPPELPLRSFDPPRIHLVAPIPGLDGLGDDDLADDEVVIYDDLVGDDLADDDLDADEVVVYDDLLDDDLDADEVVVYDDLVADEPVGHEPIAPQPALQPRPALQPKSVQPKSVVPRKPARPRPTQAPPPRRNPTPILVTALIVAVVVALGVTGVLLRRNLSAGGSTAATTTAPAPATEVAEAATWIRANLPTTATIGTDAATRDELTRWGFPSIQLTDLDQPSSRARYAVITPTVRAAGATAGSPMAALLSEALPVAVFGDGQARVEISQLGAMSTSLTNAQQARLMAGRALARNPRLHIVTNLTSTVADGRLDMRAATLLAVLAGQRSTALLKLPQAGAESRAGAPIRTIVLQLIGDPTTADQLLGRTVRALSPSLAPYQTARQPDGSYQIVWLPDLSLTPPAN